MAFIEYFDTLQEEITAWKVSVFGDFLVLIFPHSDLTRARKTPNTDTFYAVDGKGKNELGLNQIVTMELIFYHVLVNTYLFHLWDQHLE